MVTDALAAGFAELLWLDPAVVFDPADVERLRKLAVPFACGVYPWLGRQGLTCEFLPGTTSVQFGKAGGPISIVSCGLGFSLIRREVFEAIANSTPPGTPVAYFGNSDPAATVAEDAVLCERARACGFEIVADTSIRLWRVGPTRLSWEDAGGDRERHANFTLHVHPVSPQAQPIRRYLLVKAHVGFGDRLQCLSHAIQYAAKYGRILCVDWRDSIWSDGSVDFHTYFDLCGVPTISLSELLGLPLRDVYPLAWANQIDRPADANFTYRGEYACQLEDADHAAELIVYSSVGLRTYYASNLSLLRVKAEYRNLIVKQLRRYAAFHTVVHLRGTDRVPVEKHAEYVAAVTGQMTGQGRQEPVLVVTDCFPMFKLFRAEFETAVLRTPNLEGLDPGVGTHFGGAGDKHASNVELLTDFFLLVYAAHCYHDPETCFSKMARVIRCGDFPSILGYEPVAARPTAARPSGIPG